MNALLIHHKSNCRYIRKTTKNKIVCNIVVESLKEDFVLEAGGAGALYPKWDQHGF